MFNPRRLSLARMRRRLTAKALSEMTGLAADTISRLENGSNPPDEATVEKLAKALGFRSISFRMATRKISIRTQ
jgi:transcriptional regulator with XRE-family HTH domain